MHSKKISELISNLRKQADSYVNTSYVQIRSKVSDEQGCTLQNELHLALEHITTLQKQKTTMLDQIRELTEAVQQMQMIQISEHECLQNQLHDLRKQLKEQNIDYEKSITKYAKDLEQIKYELYQKDQQVSCLKQDLQKKSSELQSLIYQKKNIEEKYRNIVVELQQKYANLQHFSSINQSQLKSRIDQLEADLIIIQANLKSQQENKIQLQKSYRGLSQENQKLKSYYDSLNRQAIFQNSYRNNDTSGKLSDQYREPEKLKDYIVSSYKKATEDAFKDISCWDSSKSRVKRSFVTRGQLLQEDIFSADKENFIPNDSTTRDLKLPQIIEQVSAFKSQFQQTPTCPYYSFFILTIQCLKINSKKFEQIAQQDLREEWKNILNKRIPLNQWERYLKTVLQKKVGFKI